MKILIIVLLVFILSISFVYGSDDELQIIQGDGGLAFSEVADSESGSFFTRNNQQNNNAGSGDADNDENTVINNEEESQTEESELVQVIEIPSDETNQRDILFDIKIEVDKKSKEISSGGSLLSVVKLLNLGNPGRVEANLNYKIIDSSDNNVYEESETVGVETQREFIKRFSLPRNLGVGTYKLGAYLTYSGQTEPAYSEDTFYIRESEKKFNYLTLIGLIAIASIIISFLLYKRFRKQTFI